MELEAFFDERTYTLTYLVYDPKTRDALVIDPVQDFDAAAVRVYQESANRLIAFVEERGLQVKQILETHAHADHLSGAQVLKQRWDCGVAIGAKIVVIQQLFHERFDLGPEVAVDGSQFDQLLVGDQTLEVGSIRVKVIHTPGHTPACVSYLIEDMVFTGDALFMPDYGTGRCDFPAGSAADLYESVAHRLYQLPDETRVFVGHDYQPGGRPLAYETTIGASKRGNIQLDQTTTKEDYVAFREKRDAGLNAPKLLLPSIQINIDAGHLPRAGKNGRRFLKLPITES